MRINTLIVAVFALLGLGSAIEKANAQIAVSIGIAPPALPVYVQPPIPGPDYIWTPGYWAWNADASDYYWVPGAWALSPRPGLLWTPGYWGWSDGAYVWNAGYWGPTVGFYGGISYGFGYTGVGFAGGYWSGGSFFYNQSVTNISNTTVITNVYSQKIVNNSHVKNVSYNGGNGGIKAQPTPQELRAAGEQHIAPTSEQFQHQRMASENKVLRASVNNGKPPVAAVTRAADFSPHSIVAAKGAGGAIKPASLTTGNGLNAHPGNGLNAHTGNGLNAHTGNGLNAHAGNGMDAHTGNGLNAHAGNGLNAHTGNGLNAHAGNGLNAQPGNGLLSAHPGNPGNAGHGVNKNAVANLNAMPHPGGPRPAPHGQPPHPQGGPKPAVQAQPHPGQKNQPHG